MPWVVGRGSGPAPSYGKTTPMHDEDLAFRCVELAVKNGAQGDPGPLAGIYFAAVKRLAPDNTDGTETDISPSHADKPPALPSLKRGNSGSPATAGKTARRKPTQNS